MQLARIKDLLYTLKLFLLLYLIVGFIPYFNTIDKIGSQWLYLGFLNTFFFIYFCGFLSILRCCHVWEDY